MHSCFLLKYHGCGLCFAVIANGLCKQLCLRLFPQISSVAYVTEPSCGTKESAHVGSSNSIELETFEREHRVYAFLVRALTKFTASDCVAGAISASSTDNYPKESIRNTLNPRDRVLRRASYWSSKGQRDPAVSETLIYKLIAGVCVITEISVRPFQGYCFTGSANIFVFFYLGFNTQNNASIGFV